MLRLLLAAAALAFVATLAAINAIDNLRERALILEQKR